jgi:hypothetical protein
LEKFPYLLNDTEKMPRTILRRLASSCALKKVVRNRKETKG